MILDTGSITASSLPSSVISSPPVNSPTSSASLPSSALRITGMFSRNPALYPRRQFSP
ncbi:hypothetical protein AHAS_Ahas18G0295600 [Arachis hypogaea]